VGSAPIRGAACADSIVVVANSLLDFVMALVRDPDAAARYAADPAGAIADAHLDVSSADVNNLIPVVAESLSTSAPAVGDGGFGAGHGGDVDTNVWASGAATAAFDAFGAFDDPGTAHQPVIHDPIGDPAATAVDVGTSSVDTFEPASLHVPVVGEAPVIDAAPVDEVSDIHDTWDVLDGHAAPLEHHDPGAAFDVFDA
jgi:hypothetical protein